MRIGLIGLAEAGRKLSAASRTKIKAARDALNDLLGDADEQTVAEARRAMLTEAAALIEAELSHDDTRQALRKALKARYPGQYPYVRDVYDTYLVFEMEVVGLGDYDPRLFRAEYTTSDDGAVALGDPVEVRQVVTYEPVGQPAPQVATEAQVVPGLLRRPDSPRPVIGDVVPLVEAKARTGGAFSVKAIGPGWGSTGYYGAEVLERDGPQVFKAGTHMYIDHPTPTELQERPERSVERLGGGLESDARWDPNGPEGPGLYADIKPLNSMKETIADLAPHIGASIFAGGVVSYGEAEGREGWIIEQLLPTTPEGLPSTIDFVTRAGRDGKVLQLVESARGQAGATPQAEGAGRAHESQEAQVNEEEARQLREAHAGMELELARLREAQVLREAREYVAEALGGEEAVAGAADLPDFTRARIQKALSANPPVREGTLDRDALRTRVEESVREESAYLAQASGLGQIRGFGASSRPQPETATDPVKLEESLAAAFADSGMGQDAAQLAARGRGR
jgi:hypothetical protein